MTVDTPHGHNCNCHIHAADRAGAYLAQLSPQHRRATDAYSRAWVAPYARALVAATFNQENNR